MNTTYRATRRIELGQLRRTLSLGDLVEFDGRDTVIAGKSYALETTDLLIKEGWLVRVGEDPQLPSKIDLQLPAPVRVPDDAAPAWTPKKPQAPHHTTPARADQELDKGGNKISYSSTEARQASGKRPQPSQRHVWNTTGPSPDWLNDPGGRTCKVCGVSERTDVIRADRTHGDGSQQYHYTDAHGVSIVAFEELACPTYVGDAASAAAYAKDHVRKVRGRVDDVEDTLDVVDVRLTKLEEDNEFLRQRLIQAPVLDAQMVADALTLIIRKASEGGESRLAERVHALLPEEDVILIEDAVELAPVKVSREE